jgi:hypothetical protein
MPAHDLFDFRVRADRVRYRELVAKELRFENVSSLRAEAMRLGHQAAGRVGHAALKQLIANARIANRLGVHIEEISR